MMSRTMYGSRRPDMKAVLRAADCVCFDVDSTLVVDEGIDELAAFVGVGKQVAQLTNNAMGGKMTFKESLSKRLNLIRPSRQEVEQFVEENPPKLTDGVFDLVESLHHRGTDVYIISGGFHSLIRPVAEALDIPASHIFANKLKFFYDGEYAGFDETQPTCECQGKANVIQSLKKKYKRVLHIGDGATDLETYPLADGFIGFGGNQVRENVRRNAPWFVTSFQELTDELDTKLQKLDISTEL